MLPRYTGSLLIHKQILILCNASITRQAIPKKGFIDPAPLPSPPISHITLDLDVCLTCDGSFFAQGFVTLTAALARPPPPGKKRNDEYQTKKKRRKAGARIVFDFFFCVDEPSIQYSHMNKTG